MSLRPIVVIACLASAAAAHAQPADEVDLELVLAVDVSRSMDIREQELQRSGYVAAFRHPEIAAAIGSGLLGRIAVTYVEWAGPGSHSVVVPWTILDGAGSAAGFADALEQGGTARRRGTSISGALGYSAWLLENNAATGARRVIDISGDGPNNVGPPVEAARQQVLEAGITINGLPIMLNEQYDGLYSIRDLDIYYEDCVIGGPGAFLVTVESSDRFAEAIRRKLVLEIASVPPVMMPIQFDPAPPRIDCMIGERMRESWLRQ